jgi:RNA polymerase sigma-70 factor, ECF subfamily
VFDTSATLLFRLKADGEVREVAWADFCDRYEPIIAGFARRLGLPAQQIPDLVQQILLGFFAAQPRFTYDPGLGRFRGYLKTCVVHEIQRLRTTALASEARARAAAVPEASIDTLWDTEWESHLLERAMVSVKEHYNQSPTKQSHTFEAFHRAFVLNQPPERVAEDLGISRDSVYQAKTRVLARLRVELSALAEEVGD